MAATPITVLMPTGSQGIVRKGHTFLDQMTFADNETFASNGTVYLAIHFIIKPSVLPPNLRRTYTETRKSTLWISYFSTDRIRALQTTKRSREGVCCLKCLQYEDLPEGITKTQLHTTGDWVRVNPYRNDVRPHPTAEVQGAFLPVTVYFHKACERATSRTQWFQNPGCGWNELNPPLGDTTPFTIDDGVTVEVTAEMQPKIAGKTYQVDYDAYVTELYRQGTAVI